MAFIEFNQISKEQFELAQRIRGSRPRTNTDKTLKNPLSGLMFCSECGAQITYNTYRNKGVDFSPPRYHCTNQVHCKSGSTFVHEIIEHMCGVLEDCIEDFEMRIQENKDDSTKLHQDLIKRLKTKMNKLELKELSQWEALHDPDPEKRMPNEIFQRLNKKLLEEKEELRQALCTAEKSAPTPVNYKEQTKQFKDALNALKDANVSAEIKNRYLKNIIERIEYKRPAAIRLTKMNRHLYPDDVAQGLAYHSEPYDISIKLRV